jgi:hypothetical protein
LKIAICTPCHRTTEAKFTQCLAEMIAHTMSAKIEWDGELVTPQIETIIVSCSILTESRNRLVAEAIHAEADYMLWSDADHVFPRDALLRLLSHNMPVVGCNYARRFSPTAPTASILDDDGKKRLVWTTKEKAEQGDMEKVAHLGLGFCLMDMRVYGLLEQQAEKEGKEHFWPLFRMDPTEDGIGVIGEDVYFFQRIRDAGVPIYLDHNLSWDVGHLHEQILTNAHAEAQQDKWHHHQQTKLDKFKKEPA